MKNKFKVSIWTILLASGILSLGLASCNKPNSSSSTSSSSSSISTSTSSSISSTISSSSSTSSISSNPNVRTYVVTFVDQNGSTNLGSTSVEKGGKIAEFPEVIDDGSGHEFAGWYYQGKPFDASLPKLYTSREERVRSKSEIIIADTLSRESIPYRYECPLHIPDVGNIYPDFTVLNVAKRKELYWEH